MVRTIILIFLIPLTWISADRNDANMHVHSASRSNPRQVGTTPMFATKGKESTASYWFENGQNQLKRQLGLQPNTKKAKNVILFLGDGMSIPTLTAARIYKGQAEGKPGEESYLSFEEFPYSALSKTYCVDSQVADSACSATAYLCGVKGNEATIGVTAAVPMSNCAPAQDPENQVDSIARWFQLDGRKSGLVTTARVTHASPTGVYGHIGHRNWESDTDVLWYDVQEPCEDIASQLLTSETGKNLNVIMGGGRSKFLPNTTLDEENVYGERQDGRNLIEEWISSKRNIANFVYTADKQGLSYVTENTDYLLGLFESSHCKYHLDAEDNDPSLAEMTEAAIKVLSKGGEGFFLFVEGGRIDMAHHDTLAKKALDETLEFAKAVTVAKELTEEDETLIVVTADHAHTMSISGYADRGNPILGLAARADDGLPIATLSYANGPGYRPEVDGRRRDLTYDNMHDSDYMSPSLAPLGSETHGGDDVAIFANGPWAHLFSGVLEQSTIPYIMAYASCVGNGITMCDP